MEREPRGVVGMKILVVTLALVIVALLYLTHEDEAPHVHLETNHLQLDTPQRR